MRTPTLAAILVSVCAAIGWSAAIADAVTKPLTTAQCLQIQAGLNQIDSYERVIKDGAGEHVVRDQYRLGEARYSIALAMTVLKPIADAVEKARLGLIAEAGGGKPIKDGSPELAKLNADYQAILARPCGAALPTIKLKDLRLGDDAGSNPIPPSVLSAIMPIIEPVVSDLKK